MNKKVFFTDLDGTLLNDQKEITPAIRQQSMKHFTVGTRLSSRQDALSPAHGFRPNGLA